MTKARARLGGVPYPRAGSLEASGTSLFVRPVGTISKRRSMRKLDPLPFTGRNAEGPIGGTKYHPSCRYRNFRVLIGMGKDGSAGLEERVSRPPAFG